jgi:L-Ala-D/L-Glu epimerase
MEHAGGPAPDRRRLPRRRRCGWLRCLQPATRIRKVDIARLDIPLHEPFGIAGGEQAAANNVLVTVELEDGARGHGEAAPLPAYNGETQADALAALAGAGEWLPGRDATAWRELGHELTSRNAAASGAARCAIETALLDALTRRDGVPLWRYFGGAGTEIETDMTVTTGTVEAASAAARAIRARGIRTLKVKIGGRDGVALDLARIEAIRDAAPDSPLILDGNAGLSRASAAELVRGLRARGIVPDLLEQWLAKDDLDGMRALHHESGWPVAADESVASPADALRVAHIGAAQVINIKLMKLGVGAALTVVKIARTYRLDLMIGGNIESVLGMTMSACFAAGHGGFRFADLDTPLFLATNPFARSYALVDGRLSVASVEAGHGVTPREQPER